MKKKIISFALMICMILPVTLLFSACGGSNNEKSEQQNNLTLKGIYQTASADVVLDIDSSNYTIHTVPSIEVTADNGTTWKAVQISYVYEEPVIETVPDDVTITYTALKYFAGDANKEEGFYYAGDESVKAGEVNGTITLAVRLAETNDYKASSASESKSYTLMAKTEESSFFAYSTKNQSINSSNLADFEKYKVLVKNENNTFFITRFDIEEDENNPGQYIATAAEITEEEELSYFKYEFKFIDFDKAYDLETNTPKQTYALLAYEDQIQTSGWLFYDARNGLTSEDYSAYTKTYEIPTGDGEHVTQYTVAYVLIRERALSTSLKANCSIVELIVEVN